MLTRQELNQINQLKIANPEFQSLFDRIEMEQQLFLQYMSYPLRNHLTLLKSSFQLIEHAHPEICGMKHWDTCKSGTDHVQKFIEQLSEFSKSLVLRRLPFNLNQLLTDLVDSIKSETCSLPISITLQITNSCPEILGDADNLYRALELLIKNSCEAVPENDGKITITLSLAENYYKITISDNGNGLPPETEKNLWIPFSSGKAHHIGLGLYTANRIILAHGGYIRLISSSPQGTSFDVCLPV